MAEAHSRESEAANVRHTSSDLLTDKPHLRLQALFAGNEHVEVEATWATHQHMIAAYREPDRRRGRELMKTPITSLSHGVPAVLSEVITRADRDKTSRRHPGLVRPTRHLQRTLRDDQ